MFAVIQLAGKQFIVSPKDSITVPHLDGEVGLDVTIPHVLLVSDDSKTSIGTPYIKNVVVKAKIVAQRKGEKITVRRFKSKVRYRKTRGFREQLTDIEILQIK